MTTVAIIPARGGSKRIARKNIKIFRGKPIIAYAIEAAKTSNIFDRIIVSTDDEEIGQVGQAYGAEFPFLRPPELSHDHADVTAVVGHAVGWLIEQGVVPSSVCCLYATAPFLQPDQIKAGLLTLQSQKWDFVFSATKFSFPIFRAVYMDDQGRVEMFHPEHLDTRSQDLPEAWHDAAQFYWGTPEAWMEIKPLFSPRSTVVELPSWQVQDIDTMEDWVRAERLHSVLDINLGMTATAKYSRD